MKRIVTVIQTTEVVVEIDETKFTPEWMEEFRGYMYKFNTIEDHIKHLAQLKARNMGEGFLEGYGEQEDMGIKLEENWYDVEMEIEEAPDGAE